MSHYVVKLSNILSCRLKLNSTFWPVKQEQNVYSVYLIPNYTCKLRGVVGEGWPRGGTCSIPDREVRPFFGGGVDNLHPWYFGVK